VLTLDDHGHEHPEPPPPPGTANLGRWVGREVRVRVDGVAHDVLGVLGHFTVDQVGQVSAVSVEDAGAARLVPWHRVVLITGALDA
jgi:hypothetical protein